MTRNDSILNSVYYMQVLCSNSMEIPQTKYVGYYVQLMVFHVQWSLWTTDTRDRVLSATQRSNFILRMLIHIERWTRR